MTKRLSKWARALRVPVTAGLLAFLALSPSWLNEQLSRRRYTEFLEPPKAEWHGRVELWHVAEFRVYQGSVTDYLQARADAYCKRHVGVHIDVVGLTVKRYNDRIARGSFPDAYSFPSGLVYREQLAPISPALPDLRGALAPACADGQIYAVPYLVSGYFLVANTRLLPGYGLALPEVPTEAALGALLQAALDVPDAPVPQLCMPSVLAARMGLVGTLATAEQFTAGQTALGVLDARALGDILRSQKGALSVEAIPVTSYTDEVQYLAAARQADEKKAAVVADFLAFLLTEGEQRRLSALGALGVTKLASAPVYTEELLTTLYAAYETPAIPDPFAYQRHRQALEEEALWALCGDPAAIASFSRRMQVVENGNI